MQTESRAQTEPDDAFSAWAALPAEQRHRWIRWGLMVTGVLLVLFAEPLGLAFVPRKYYGPRSFSWNIEDARAVALNVRFLGAMAFTAGLVERLIGAIRTKNHEA